VEILTSAAINDRGRAVLCGTARSSSGPIG
jgi:hypothetical protein